jgi:hypothetical protein
MRPRAPAPPTLIGNSLRTVGRILSAAAIATGDPFLAQLRLILQLAALAEAVIDLRTAQRHAAQAAAAWTAAERLYAARRCYTAPPASRARARTHGNQPRGTSPSAYSKCSRKRQRRRTRQNPQPQATHHAARRRLGSAVPPGNPIMPGFTPRPRPAHSGHEPRLASELVRLGPGIIGKQPGDPEILDEPRNRRPLHPRNRVLDGPDGQARAGKHGKFAQHGHPVPGELAAPHQAREHSDDRQCRLDKREGRELLRHRESRRPTV